MRRSQQTTFTVSTPLDEQLKCDNTIDITSLHNLAKFLIVNSCCYLFQQLHMSRNHFLQ